MRAKIAAILLFAAYIIWGGFQERVKIDTNLLLDFAPRISHYQELTPNQRNLALDALIPKVAYDYYYSHARVDALLHFNLHQLDRFKWVFTALCATLCLLVSLLVLYLLYKGPFIRWWVLGLFGSAAIISAGCLTMGHLLDASDSFYPVAHKFAAAAQSPFAVAMLVFLQRLRTFGT